MDNMAKIRQTLTGSIFEVFERMFYVFLEPAERADDEYHYGACITFSGPLRGELTAAFSRPLAKVMLHNMLNVGNDEMNEGLMEDCLKESVNMVCGNFLSKYDSAQVFDLSIPTYTSGRQAPEIEAGADSEAIELNFLSGQGKLTVMMTFPNTAKAAQ
jgi:CheY-specific phosphatase CheX